MKRVLIVLVLISVVFAGCEQPILQQKPKQVMTPESSDETIKVIKKKPIQVSQDAVQPSPSSAFQPFYVYVNKGSRQNHYIPSGFMPNGKCVTFSDIWQKDCRSDKTCIKVEYDVECSRKDQKWAGVYWLNPANNWGSRKGGFNLTGAQKLTFWAKGEKGGEQIQEFTVGGISGDYPDSDTIVIGPVILSSTWRQYTIDLRGRDLSYISGGFAWTTSEDVNPQDCTFYLDDIRFE